MSATPPTRVIAVVAMTPSRAIGKRGLLPWQVLKLKRDMRFFKELTSETSGASGATNGVVMGRKTWESIPPQFRPLEGRVNYVVSSDQSLVQMSNVRVVGSVRDAVESAWRERERVFIIGGGRVYKEALDLNLVDSVYVTVVHREFDECDVYFPELSPHVFDGPFPAGPPDAFESGVRCSFTVYHRKPPIRHEEYQYLDLVREIISTGVVKADRTGTGTKSVFGRTMRFTLRDGTLPLLTTKKTFFRGVAVELLWFISGDTSNMTLHAQNVSIWNGNSTREYLDSVGLRDREVGDLGPIYGFQWRHFGAEYRTMRDSYEGQGVDQLAEVVRQIKHDPDSRRILLTAWNPTALKQMALPPCHLLAQFYVSNGELSCQMYQRSADMGLGVPFNIASYALLTHMLAKVCGLRAGEFVHVLGDCHVYLNHVDALQEQLTREPRAFPKLVIRGEQSSIDDFKMEDFMVVGYEPHAGIKMQMAV